MLAALVVPDRPLGRCQPADADGYIVPCGAVSAVTPERQGVTLMPRISRQGSARTAVSSMHGSGLVAPVLIACETALWSEAPDN